MPKWRLKNVPQFFIKSIQNFTLDVYDCTICQEFSCFLLLPQRISCDPLVKMIEPIGHSPAATGSNLVFRIRYGKHNNIIGLITGQPRRALQFTFQFGSFFTPTLSETIMIYYRIFVQANYGWIRRFLFLSHTITVIR